MESDKVDNAPTRKPLVGFKAAMAAKAAALAAKKTVASKQIDQATTSRPPPQSDPPAVDDTPSAPVPSPAGSVRSPKRSEMAEERPSPFNSSEDLDGTQPPPPSPLLSNATVPSQSPSSAGSSNNKARLRWQMLALQGKRSGSKPRSVSLAAPAMLQREDSLTRSTNGDSIHSSPRGDSFPRGVILPAGGCLTPGCPSPKYLLAPNGLCSTCNSVAIAERGEATQMLGSPQGKLRKTASASLLGSEPLGAPPQVVGDLTRSASLPQGGGALGSADSGAAPSHSSDAGSELATRTLPAKETEDDVYSEAAYSMGTPPRAWVGNIGPKHPGGLSNSTAARLQASAAEVAAAQARPFFSPQPLQTGEVGGRKKFVPEVVEVKPEPGAAEDVLATPEKFLEKDKTLPVVGKSHEEDKAPNEDTYPEMGTNSVTPAYSATTTLSPDSSVNTRTTPTSSWHPRPLQEPSTFRHSLDMPEFVLDPTLEPKVYVTQEMARQQLLARRGAKVRAEQFAQFKALQTESEHKANSMTDALAKLQLIFSERAKHEGSQVRDMKRAIYFDTLGMKIEESAQQDSSSNSFDDGTPSNAGYVGDRTSVTGTANASPKSDKESETQRSEVASRGKDLILRFSQTSPGKSESPANDGKPQGNSAETTEENFNQSPAGSSAESSSSEKDAYQSPAGSSAASTADEDVSTQEGCETSPADKLVTVEQLTREARELCLKRIENGHSASCCAHLVSVQVLSSDVRKDWVDTFLSLTDGALWSTTYFSLGRLDDEAAAPDEELSPHPVVQVLDFKGKGCDVDFEECSGAPTGFALVVKIPGYKTVKIAPKRFRHLAAWGAALIQAASTLNAPKESFLSSLQSPTRAAPVTTTSATSTATIGKAPAPSAPPNDGSGSPEARRVSLTRYRHPLLSVPSPPRSRSHSTPPAPPQFPMAFATAEALALPVKKLTRRTVHPPLAPGTANHSETNLPSAMNDNIDGTQALGRLTPPGLPLVSGAFDEELSSLYSNTPSLESTANYYMVLQVRHFPHDNTKKHASAATDSHNNAPYDRSQRGSSVSRSGGVSAGSSFLFQPIDSRVSQSLPRSGGPSPEITKRTAPLSWAQAYRQSMTRRSRGVPGKTKS